MLTQKPKGGENVFDNIMGRSKLPEGKKRIRVFGRVDPATVSFLDSLEEENHGRALDKTVAMARLAQGIRDALRELDVKQPG